MLCKRSRRWTSGVLLGDGDVRTADVADDDNDDDARSAWDEERRRRWEIVCAVNSRTSCNSAIATAATAKLRACECVRTYVRACVRACVRVRSSQSGDTRGPRTHLDPTPRRSSRETNPLGTPK